MEDIGIIVDQSLVELVPALDEWGEKAKYKGILHPDEIASIRKTIVDLISGEGVLLKIMFSFKPCPEKAREKAKRRFNHIFKGTLWVLKHGRI